MAIIDIAPCELPGLAAQAEPLAGLLRDDDAMQRLYRVAERGARWPRGSLRVREIVTDVIEDMAIGDTVCDPERPLVPQVRDEVRRRAKRERRGAPRVSFIELGDAPASALIADADQHSGSRDAPDVPDAAALVRSIREQARGDVPVLQLLAFYERGIVARRDVLRAGMKPWVYRAARERLTAYAAIAVAGASITDEVLPQLDPLQLDPHDAATTLSIGPAHGSVPAALTPFGW